MVVCQSLLITPGATDTGCVHHHHFRFGGVNVDIDMNRVNSQENAVERMAIFRNIFRKSLCDGVVEIVV